MGKVTAMKQKRFYERMRRQLKIKRKAHKIRKRKEAEEEKNIKQKPITKRKKRLYHEWDLSGRLSRFLFIETGGNGRLENESAGTSGTSRGYCVMLQNRFGPVSGIDWKGYPSMSRWSWKVGEL